MPFRDGLAADFASGRVTALGGDVEIINEAGPFAPSIARRGQGTRGKQRTSIEIISEPVLMDLDSLALGAKPAEAIRAELEKDTKNISELASPATIARRRAAAENQSATSTQRRYGGGRIGFKAPNLTPRLFNDSGRLAEGWFVRENKSDESWTVNSPANRLDPSTFGAAAFQAMLDKLRSLMPILQDMRELFNRPAFNAAVAESVRDMVTKGEMNGDAQSIAKLKQLAAARKRAALAFVRAARGALGF